jgi:UMF1 family MFS transporter
LFAWCTFDFANSGYTTVIITAVFNAYFVGVVAGGRPSATFLWTLALAVSYLFVLLSAPILGAIADYSAAKKRFLAWTTTLCVIATACLAFVGPGDIWLAAVLIIISNTFYAAGENLIAAFLPDLAPPEELGKLSGYGWAWGYLGGLLSLGLCLIYLRWANSVGIETAQAVPHTAIIVAVMFGAASIPTFLWLRERPTDRPKLAARDYVLIGFSRLRTTLSEAREFSELFKLLLCLMVYHAGINVVSTIAAVFAQEALGFTTQETIQLILVVNISAAAGAFVFGPIQDRFGSKKTIAATLLLWTATTILAATVQTKAPFYLVGNMAGLAIGSSQSAGRAMVGLFSPQSKTAEFFGLWGMAIKTSSILGPLSYGLLNLATGSHRIAVLATTVFFIAGLGLLLTIDEAEGKRAAREYVERA